MNQIGSKTIEVFASRVGIPIKASYRIAVMSYTLMKGIPMSTRMSDAGGPFFLKGLGVLGHMLFIYQVIRPYGDFLDKKEGP